MLRTWEGFAEMTDAPNRFLNEGEVWTITYGGRSFRLKDTKGLRYIAAMLAAPGREFHAIDLVATSTGATGGRSARAGVDPRSLRDQGLSVAPLGDSGEVLDRQAKDAYRRRIRDLEEEIEEAERFNDAARAARAHHEMDALEQQLSAAFGLGGKARKSGSTAERARVNVRNSIASALRAIGTQDPKLRDHLSKSVRTGTFCWYASEGMRWQTTTGMNRSGEADEPERSLVTLLFTDIVSRNKVSDLGDKRWRQATEKHEASLRAQLDRHRGRPVKSWGDCFVSTFDTPADAIRCATGIGENIEAGAGVRAAIHTGECERRGDELTGIGINIAARIHEEAEAGEILVSSTVRELVAGSGIGFEDRGFYALRGIPGTWRLFAATIGARVARRPSRGTAKGLSLMIVDDHPMWRQTLRTVLEGSGVGIVVAEASDGGEAVEMAATARPQAVVMDMNLITMNGIEATRGLLEILPDTRVLMLSSSDEREDVLDAVKAGASGYLLKTAGPDEVADAVRRTFAGELVFPPELANVVLKEFRRMGRTKYSRARSGKRT